MGTLRTLKIRSLCHGSFSIVLIIYKKNYVDIYFVYEKCMGDTMGHEGMGNDDSMWKL